MKSQRIAGRDTERPINSRFAGRSITPIKTLGAGKADRPTLIGQFSPLNIQFITIFKIFRQRRRRRKRTEAKTSFEDIIRSLSR